MKNTTLLLAACSGAPDSADTAASADCGPDDPDAAASTMDLFGASAAWDFPDDDGLQIQWSTQGSGGWDFGLDAVMIEYMLEYYPSTTCSLDGTGFVCDEVVWGSDHRFNISGAFSADFRAIEATLDRDSPDEEEGDSVVTMAGVRGCPAR